MKKTALRKKIVSFILVEAELLEHIEISQEQFLVLLLLGS
jgi:hypothetical protein